jgi:HPr kinase/phosphorylase
MNSKAVRVKNFLDSNTRVDPQICLIAGESGLDKEVRVGDINRPGLTLAGFFDFFAYDRIQIFGLGETAYMRQRAQAERERIYEKFFSYDVLCCIFTHDERPDALFCRMADSRGVPVMVTRRGTTNFTTLLVHFLDDLFAPKPTMHATLVDVFGVGVLLQGKSGVGKSECALELIERGHRLVADDMVEIRKIDEARLMGNGTALLKHYMEIRGLGIINVRDIFGIRSVRNRKRIELVALLEEWDSETEYDRLGLDEKKYAIMDIDVSFITIPVRPGRNIPIIIETAALNQRLKKLGVHSAAELDRKIQKLMHKEKSDS